MAGRRRSGVRPHDRPVRRLSGPHAPPGHRARPRIPTLQHLPRGYRNDGSVPHWRAILDDAGRVMVMITYNNDIGDGWQWADEPRYPADSAHLAVELGVNFAVYALTH